MDLTEIRWWLWWWTAGEYLFATVVLIGVIGEYVADFTEWAKRCPKRNDLIGKLSTLVLIVGLLGELATLVQVNRFAGLEVAELEHRTEELRSSNLAMEKRIALLRERAIKSAEVGMVQHLWTDSEEHSRWLKQLGVYMDSLPGTPLFIQPVPDFRSQLLADRIARAMRQHGWDVQVVDESVTNNPPLDIQPGLLLYTWHLNRSTFSLDIDPSLIDSDPGWLAAVLLGHDLELRSGLKFPAIMSSDESCGPTQQVIKFLLPSNGVLLTIGALESANLLELWELLRDSNADSKE